MHSHNNNYDWSNWSIQWRLSFIPSILGNHACKCIPCFTFCVRTVGVPVKLGTTVTHNGCTDLDQDALNKQKKNYETGRCAKYNDFYHP